jgi:tetratricopeptide (TPR) repeat protein
LLPKKIRKLILEYVFSPARHTITAPCGQLLLFGRKALKIPDKLELKKMKKDNNKLLTDLQRLMATQDFKLEEEARKFLDSIAGQKIPSFPKEALTAQEQAQELVFAAYGLSPAKGRACIEKALILDPECIEAYEYLADMEPVPQIAIAFYERGIAIGRKLFGGKYLKEHKGMFWGFHETRPFMRCLQSYSDSLYDMGKVKECVDVLEELIALNPNDNQGVRDQLLLYLIQLDEKEKFKNMLRNTKKTILPFHFLTGHYFHSKQKGRQPNQTKN